MQKVYLSDSGPKVSKAIYSFWRWENEKMKDAEKAEKIINQCLDLGINTFDHGDTSADLETEHYFGQILNKRKISRHEIVLFAKTGLRKNNNGQSYFDHSPEYLSHSLDQLLSNLNTDYLDIFLLNGFDFTAEPEETAQVLEGIVRSGKAKHIGIANVNLTQHKLLAKQLNIPIVTSHIEMNLLNTSALFDGRLDFIKEQYSKPLVWSPLAGGEILEGGSEKAINIRKTLQGISDKYPQSNIEQIAVAWLMAVGALPIIGSLFEQRIANVAAAADIQLSREDWYSIYNICQQFR